MFDSLANLAIGTWQFSQPIFFNQKPIGHPKISFDEIADIFSFCYERGIRIVDTAPSYGDNFQSEKYTGQILKSYPRENWKVITKFGLIYELQNSNHLITNYHKVDLSLKNIPKQCDQSLRNLKTDYIDVFLFHVLPKKKEIFECVEILQQLKKIGKIKHFGFSTNNEDFINFFLENYKETFYLEYCHNLFSKQDTFYRLLEKNKNQIKTIARGVLASGVLSDDFLNKKFSKDDYRTTIDFSKYLEKRKKVIDTKTQKNPELSLEEFAYQELFFKKYLDIVLMGGNNLKQYQIIADLRESLKYSSR